MIKVDMVGVYKRDCQLTVLEHSVIDKAFAQLVEGNDSLSPDHLSQPEMDSFAWVFRLGFVSGMQIQT